jgi:carbon storage regulator
VLVISRKFGERILVGDNIVITLVRIGHGNCRIGIDAPKDINIVREELVKSTVPRPAEAATEPPQETQR